MKVVSFDLTQGSENDIIYANERRLLCMERLHVSVLNLA